MKLRDDPAAGSAMAGVLTQSNSFKLTGKIGRRPTDGELYMAHFMGVGGAAKLITNAEDNPQASGARMFPNAAAANRSIFYDQSRARAQRLRSLFGADGALRRRRQFARRRASRWPRSAAASNADAVASAAPAAGTPVDNAAYLSSFPDATRGRRRSRRPPQRTSGNRRRPTRSSVRCSRPAIEPQPVSPAVHELWGNSSSLTSVASATSVALQPGCVSSQRSARQRQRAARARSVQRPHRHLQQLACEVAPAPCAPRLPHP